MNEETPCIPPTLFDEVDCHRDHFLLRNILNGAFGPVECQKCDIGDFAGIGYLLSRAVDNMGDKVGLKEFYILE